MEQPACPINIDSKGQRQRRNFGILMIAIGCLAGLFIINYETSSGIPWQTKLLVFIPFFFGALGITQAKQKT